MTDPGPGARPRTLRLGAKAWPPGTFGIMAVINRTPDSFVDRGATRDFGPALDAASRAVADGAEIVDIGGVKAGPGDEVTPAAEIDRVAGLVAAVRERHPDVVISVDTWRADVAEVVPAHDFGKNTWQSLEVTRRLGELTGTGWPVLVAVADKDFIGETLGLTRRVL